MPSPHLAQHDVQRLDGDYSSAWSQIVQHAIHGRHQLYLMEIRRVKRAKPSTQYWFFPPEKKQELLISEDNARKPNGILGNKWEQPSIPLHTNFHCGRHFILICHLSTPTRQNRKNTTHTYPNNLQHLLTDPNNTSPREVSLKEAQEGPEQSLTQPFLLGKELVLKAARPVC